MTDIFLDVVDWYRLRRTFVHKRKDLGVRRGVLARVRETLGEQKSTLSEQKGTLHE